MNAIHNYAVPLRKIMCFTDYIDNPAEWPAAQFYVECIMPGLANSDNDDANSSKIPTLNVLVISDTSQNGEATQCFWESIETRSKRNLGSG
jgi:hypothetical protein